MLTTQMFKPNPTLHLGILLEYLRNFLRIEKSLGNLRDEVRHAILNDNALIPHQSNKELLG